jgi:hypothetical protein
VASPQQRAVQDPPPNGGRARLVRLPEVDAGEVHAAVGILTCTAVVPSIGVALSGELLLAVIVFAACLTLFALILGSIRLITGRATSFEMEVRTDRLRVLSTRGPSHDGWVDYPRGEVGSVTVQDGWLTVTDHSGHRLVRHATKGWDRKLRRALERHHWC